MHNLDNYTLDSIIKTAGRIDYHTWWDSIRSLGYCTNPITLHKTTEEGQKSIKVRCGNRKSSICPSCSELYAGDMWQLIQTGLTGGKHDIPETISNHPLIFLTLTAPSYGSGTIKHTKSTHGNTITTWLPDNTGTYDYIGHLLFTWHAPELWRRFTINLRRELTTYLKNLDINPKTIKLSFLKIMEYQTRAIPHYHAILRLDQSNQGNIIPPTGINLPEFYKLIHKATQKTYLIVNYLHRKITLTFGEQTDIQSITSLSLLEENSSHIQSPKVSSYLAKYVTKSITELGIPTQKITAYNYQVIDLSNHHRKICDTINELAQHPNYTEFSQYYHTLGYRGHITTKSRSYSTTLTHLRNIRHHYKQDQNQTTTTTIIDDIKWEYHHTGHKNIGEYQLVKTAALKAQYEKILAREAKRLEKDLNHEYH